TGAAPPRDWGPATLPDTPRLLFATVVPRARRLASLEDRSVDFWAALGALGAAGLLAVGVFVARCFGFRAVAGMRSDTRAG
ncbi:MAG TPA: hypothetical protein VEJ23_05430, partial [Solirubrobacteraceae bacterium]|nr:hypothetical protein [Solirubrobacteraceae bacterium]